MHVISLSMITTLMAAVLVLLVGRYFEKRVSLFSKYFIPAPVIGGVIFSFITLFGHMTDLFVFTFDDSIRQLFMVAFFTTIGFSASLKMLKRGGIQVVFFLLVALVLAVLQNLLGVGLASAFGLNPLIGVAAGSVALTGGHGTAGAFGPLLESAGAEGATAVAITAATFGLISGCVIGGPVSKLLLLKHAESRYDDQHETEENIELKEDRNHIYERSAFDTILKVIIVMGVGSILADVLNVLGLVLPVYIGPMIVAAITRNVMDKMGKKVNTYVIDSIGNISLSLFLSMALMGLRLWDISVLALPLVVILLAQTLLMALYSYFVTYNCMGRDYDAVVLATGHCGFGMGGTPNAMANMEAFTESNGPSQKAFFVLPLVGALFIDFANASLITLFIYFFK
ncbi:sodium/glutamate symporter [Plesiomonas shigelloides]|uniref:sodium/glutamate symporter n=1 Tax=Plesiomonas shigelloides TaxID=703 RepID=UPI0012625C21|nr:sodium/glutamate symporter [Plesiomonas shigelloides]KAB7665524.1 sodium/glutamate symporter [Plesiomonas shigelloides]